MTEESVALLRIAARIDSKAVKAAQTGERKAIRQEGRVLRAEMTARHKFEKKELSVQIAMSVEHSDDAIALHFAQKRISQLDSGTLATAIASADKNLLLNADFAHDDGGKGILMRGIPLGQPIDRRGTTVAACGIEPDGTTYRQLNDGVKIYDGSPNESERSLTPSSSTKRSTLTQTRFSGITEF